MNDIVDFDITAINLRNGLYQRIGSGSGRSVFDLNNGYVIKVARNYKGIAQNEVESYISSSVHSDIFAKTIQVSKDFHFLIMVKAQPLQNFSEVREYFHVSNNRELFQLDEFQSFITEYELLLNDLCRTVNWGMIDHRPVIIDYGFTKKVKRKYYRRF